MHILGFGVLVVLAILLFAFSLSSSMANATSMLFNPTTFKVFALLAAALGFFILITGVRRKS
jgi:hypothetical protein